MNWGRRQQSGGKRKDNFLGPLIVCFGWSVIFKIEFTALGLSATFLETSAPESQVGEEANAQAEAQKREMRPRSKGTLSWSTVGATGAERREPEARDTGTDCWTACPLSRTSRWV